MIRELAKLAVYHDGKQEKKRKKNARETLEAIFSTKYEPEPPPPDERKKLKRPNDGEGRGTSGLDTMKTAHEAFLIGMRAAFDDFEKQAVLMDVAKGALGAVKGVYNAGHALGSRVSPWSDSLRHGGDGGGGFIGGVGALGATAGAIGAGARVLRGEEEAQPLGPNPTSFFRPPAAAPGTGGPFTR